MIPNLVERPGWLGMHTTEQAEGAYPNGSRVRKANSQPGDSYLDGTPGTVIGSGKVPDGTVINGVDLSGGFFYFVEFAPAPRCATGILGRRLELAE